MIKFIGAVMVAGCEMYNTRGPIVLDGPPIVIVDAMGQPVKHHHVSQYSLFPAPNPLVASR
jgi:hypothetical protein